MELARTDGPGQDRPPDILLVILDGGRADDLPGGTDPIPGMPFSQALFQESLSFPRAVAPAPWTVPSHASLFTGLYPWESGVHLKRSLRLEPSIPTLAGLLHQKGYASFSASANGYISPDFGLTTGFDAAAWGAWWERFIHLPGEDRPPASYNFRVAPRPPHGAGLKLLEWPAKWTNRRPILLDLLNQLTAHLLTPGEPYSPHVGPWVEGAVARWLQDQPAERPVFCFVNFFEAHEPFIIDPAQVEGGMTHRRLAQLRMDKTNFLAGRWRPSPEEFRDLRRLNRAVVRSLDVRLRRLREVFERAGRWQNTLVVLAADHGQAFGERGYLFHGVRLWEPVVRVPLWIRWPDGRYRGRKGVGWASLIDVVPTLLDEAGVARPRLPSASSLLELIDQPRLGPAMSMSDGTPARNTLARMVPPSVWKPWDEAHLAGYSGAQKVILNVATDRIQLYDLAHDPREESDLGAGLPPALVPLAQMLRENGQMLLHGKTEAPTQELEQRLRSWGYA